MPKESCPLYHRIFGRVHVVFNSSTLANDSKDEASPYAYFTIGSELMYEPFLDDFGPPNLLMLHKFCRKLDGIIQDNPHRSTALCVSPDPKAQTNAGFYLGAYMLMQMDYTPYEAKARLAPLKLIPFRDIGVISDIKRCASSSTTRASKDKHGSFQLSLDDCLDALQRTKGLGWVDLAQHSNRQDAGGAFDAEEYEFLDNPLNADLHEAIDDTRAEYYTRVKAKGIACPNS